MEKKIAPGDAPYTATVYTSGRDRIVIDHGLSSERNAASYSVKEAWALIDALEACIIEIEGERGY